jgi:hypothetical protein
MSYENETCEGCVWRGETRRPSGVSCGGCTRCEDSDHDLPDHFAPSLECRKVRALERLASCVTDGKAWNHFEVYDNGRNDQ